MRHGSTKCSATWDQLVLQASHTAPPLSYLLPQLATLVCSQNSTASVFPLLPLVLSELLSAAVLCPHSLFDRDPYHAPENPWEPTNMSPSIPPPLSNLSQASTPQLGLLHFIQLLFRREEKEEK